MSRSRYFVYVCAGFLLAVSARATTADYSNEARSYNIAHGRVVFQERCLRCHESGRKGAPVLGEVDDWRERLEQPLNVLITHAIEGHGRMPARGDQEISNQDVAAAVAFVVDRTQTLMRVDDLNDLPATAAGGDVSTKPPSSDEAVLQMFLMLLGKDRWK